MSAHAVHAAYVAGVVDVGLGVVRDPVLAVLRSSVSTATAPVGRLDVLVSEARVAAAGRPSHAPSAARPLEPATSGAGAPTVAPGGGETPPDPDRERMVALVHQAQGGDAEAFGQLYGRYVEGVYRFCYHRVSSVTLAEDLTSETFFRALRGIGGFRWQGRDFGAWLTAIARNAVADHYRSGRTRLETVTAQLPQRDDLGPGPEEETLTRLTNAALGQALRQLPGEQRDCLVMRFLRGLTTAETAEVLGRSEGAVRQLQLRAVRNLAKRLPRDLR
jgi:RNA polymerase sigma-70 factor (ECF subfamily)